MKIEEKLYMQKEIEKICMEVTEREINRVKNGNYSTSWINGYRKAVNDILWNLFSATQNNSVPQIVDMEDHMMRKIKQYNLKISVIPISIPQNI